MDRRMFIKAITAAGASALLNPGDIISRKAIANKHYSYDEKGSVEINLFAGWNLISIRANPAYRNIKPVLASILWALDSVWTYDVDTQKWLVYLPDDPASSNNLDIIKPGRGYWFKMRNSAILNIQGQPSSEAVLLKQGWNLIGYNGNIAKPVNECISSIKCRSICTYDPIQSKWFKYSPDAPDYLNDLDFMESGKGYWMDVEKECVWNI